MKRVFYFIAALSVLICSCDKETDIEPISQLEALKIVESYYLDNDYDVFISESIIPGKTKILCSETISSPSYDGWLVFIDEHPGANWEHTCKLIFINVKTGEYNVIEEKFPPDISGLTLIYQKENGIKID